MAIEPIKGFYVHDEVTDTDGVAKIGIDGIDDFKFNVNNAVDIVQSKGDVLELSELQNDKYINTDGQEKSQTSFKYASIEITNNLVGKKLYVSGSAWYAIKPYVFVGNSGVVYPDVTGDSTPTQYTDLEFTPNETGTLYVQKYWAGTYHHFVRAYKEGIGDTIDYDARKDVIAFVPKSLTLTQNKLMHADDGAIISVTGEYYITDYIEVPPTGKVTITTQHFYENALYCFFDKNKEFISGKNSEGGSSITSIQNECVTVPKLASYIVVGIYATSTMREPYLCIGAPQNSASSRKWADKKWVCIGDSLTEYNKRTAKHYYDYVADVTGIEVVNMGVSGTGYARASDNFMTRVLNVPTDADVITIFGSGNDGGAGLELGTASDTGTETMGGVINTTIDNLYSILPVVQLGIVTPTPWVGNMPSDSGFMERYSNLIVEICKRRSIPCLDLFHCSNLNPNSSEVRAAAYSKDEGSGVHPDETGHKIIAPRFKAFLETLLM